MPQTVVVGVSGGIAAYKSAYLVSALKKRFDVHVIMTENALEFVSVLTFETLSGNAVITGTFEKTQEFDVKHVSLAQKADVFLVAPATANVIAKVASGIADDMLTTTLLAAKCPVILAPAMNTAMYEDAATQENISILKSRGYYVMDTGEGLLACGDTGAGRMREPDEIIVYMHQVLSSLLPMHCVHVLVSAGPTREMIDPVRFLSNRSSGKMGFCLAKAAVEMGADVTLVSGPVEIDAPASARRVDVVSAAEMAAQMLSLASEADIIIMAAAVADYTPKEYAPQKIKKSGDMTIELMRTLDILKELGERKQPGQLLMGFAAETQNCENNAKDKLLRKNLDIIALNDVARPGEGFGSDSNNIRLFFSDGTEEDLGTADKRALAKQIIAITAQRWRAL
jgi:phosphopantothenoylcysteine decarboxylase/phosphopantothenate--cysteine ligase